MRAGMPSSIAVILKIEDILKPFALLSFITTAMAASVSVANDTLPDSDANESDRISVIGTRSPQTDIDLPAAIQIISREQIERSGAQSVQQVLATLGGLQVNDVIGNGGRGASLSLRGFGENGVNNILVLVDGRKLNNPSLAGPDLSSIALQNVVRIEILYGSAGALYGDQASAGVINIITGAPDAQRITLQAGRGSDDLERYQASVQQALANGLSYRVAAEQRLADNFRDNNEQAYQNWFADLGLQLADAKLSLNLQQTADDLRLPGSLSRAQRDRNRDQASTPQDFSDRNTDAINFAIDLPLGEHWRLLADINQRDETGDGALYGGSFEYDTQIKALQPRVTGEIAGAHGDILLTAGLDQEKADASTDYGFGVTRIDQRHQDVYAQLTVPVAANWTLTGGGRHSQFEGDHNTGAELDQSLDVFQLGVGVTLSENQRLFLRRDDGFRWPTADENGFISPTIDQLAPQQSSSWELGLATTIRRVSFTTVFYRLQLHDEIVYDPSADGPFGPGSGANINLDDSEREGMAMRGTWSLPDAWHLNFNYSQVEASFNSGSFSGNTVPFGAEQQLGMGLSWQAQNGLTLAVDAQYSGERYRAGDNANEGDRLGGYTVMNAAARWQGDKLFVVTRINNLADKHYDGFSGGVAPYDYYYPAPGRQAELHIGWRF